MKMRITVDISPTVRRGVALCYGNTGLASRDTCLLMLEGVISAWLEDMAYSAQEEKDDTPDHA